MKMYTIFGYKKMSAILQVIASSKPNKLHLDIQLIALKWTLCNNYLNIKANKFKLNNDAQLLNQCIILKQKLETQIRSKSILKRLFNDQCICRTFNVAETFSNKSI